MQGVISQTVTGTMSTFIYCTFRMGLATIYARTILRVIYCTSFGRRSNTKLNHDISAISFLARSMLCLAYTKISPLRASRTNS